jgi:Uncharacterized protein/domain associated with GTPases
MARWPLDPSKLWDAWREITSAADVAAGIVLAGEPALVARTQELLGAGGGSARVWEGLPSALGRGSLGPTETLLVFVEPHAEDAMVSALRAAQPVPPAVVVVDDGPAATGALTWYEKHIARVSFADTDLGWRQVWQATVDAAEEHVVALGRRYPVLRHMAAERIIRRTSRQNALIGVVFILPGTDMPVMTLNQIKMVLAIAAIFGGQISQERAIELVGVVGAGFGFRAVARQAFDLVPGLGWAVKGAVGYTGTRAMGEAALRYFEHGAPATPSRLTSIIGRRRR